MSFSLFLDYSYQRLFLINDKANTMSQKDFSLEQIQHNGPNPKENPTLPPSEPPTRPDKDIPWKKPSEKPTRPDQETPWKKPEGPSKPVEPSTFEPE